VEFDKTYAYAERKGKKKDKPRKRGLRTRGKGTWNKDKPPVMTLVKRGNTLNVRFKVIRNIQKAKLKLKWLITGPVIVNAEEYNIYNGIVSEIEDALGHWVVNHSEKDWARGSDHVNGC